MTIGRRRLCLVAGTALIVAGSASYVARPWLQLSTPFLDEHRGIFLIGWALIASGVSGALFPGPSVRRLTGPDYRGDRRTLSARQDLLSPGQRVVLVDDWIETGSQAIATRALIDDCGAELVSVAVMVDEASARARAELPAISGLVRVSDL